VSTGAIIAIAVGAVVLLLLIALALRAMNHRRNDRRREQAGQLREQARSRSIQAESARASADEQAAEAKRAQAEAEERAAQAREEHAAAERRALEAEQLTEDARAHHDQARAVDPDVSDSAQDEALAINERSKRSN
jgi:predicted Holliday junction resolvase-like endonuclease